MGFKVAKGGTAPPLPSPSRAGVTSQSLRPMSGLMQIPALEPKRTAEVCPRCKVALVRADLTSEERDVLKALRASLVCACGYRIAPGASLAIPRLLALRERERQSTERSNLAIKRQIERARATALQPDVEQIGIDLPRPHQEVQGDDEVLVLEEAPARISLPPLTEESLGIEDWQPFVGEPTLGEI